MQNIQDDFRYIDPQTTSHNTEIIKYLESLERRISNLEQERSYSPEFSNNNQGARQNISQVNNNITYSDLLYKIIKRITGITGFAAVYCFYHIPKQYMIEKPIRYILNLGWIQNKFSLGNAALRNAFIMNITDSISAAVKYPLCFIAGYEIIGYTSATVLINIAKAIGYSVCQAASYSHYYIVSGCRRLRYGPAVEYELHDLSTAQQQNNNHQINNM